MEHVHLQHSTLHKHLDTEMAIILMHVFEQEMLSLIFYFFIINFLKLSLAWF